MSDPLQDYLKSLNPKPGDQAILVYGSEYNLWLNGRHMGTATWTQDDNVGDSFQRGVIDEKGRYMIQVFLPDYWELLIKPKQ